MKIQYYVCVQTKACEERKALFTTLEGLKSHMENKHDIVFTQELTKKLYEKNGVTV